MSPSEQFVDGSAGGGDETSLSLANDGGRVAAFDEGLCDPQLPYSVIESPTSEGLLVEDVLGWIGATAEREERRRLYQDFFSQVGGMKDFELKDIQVGLHPDLRLQRLDRASSNGESCYSDERRRSRGTLGGDLMNRQEIEEGFFERLRKMTRESAPIILAPPYPASVLTVLMKYIEGGFIEVAAIGNGTEDGQEGEAREEKKMDRRLKVTCLKNGGFYNPVAAQSVVDIDYALRRIGGIAAEMEKVCKLEGIQLKLSYQNIGNVPDLVQQPPFIILTELAIRFGLADKVRDGKVVSENELLALFDHKMSSYPPTSGVDEFVDYYVQEAEKRAQACGVVNVLKKSDVIPTNGAAHAISNFRMATARTGRILHVLPSYPVQTDIELAFAKMFDPNATLIGSDMRLDKEARVWKPDFEDMEEQIKASKGKIRTISIVNPSNPTGHIWSEEDLGRLCEFAGKYNLIIESDETYWQIVAPGKRFVSVGVVASRRNVPCVCYRSGSKDAFKCGDKIGCAEFYGFDEDPQLRKIKMAYFNLMQEGVGATSIQRILPHIYQHPEYPSFLEGFNRRLFNSARVITECFDGIDGVSCIMPDGAMYTTVVFDEGVLNEHQSLPIKNDGLLTFVERETSNGNQPLDERFLIYLMATTGIVASPLSGFRGKLLGFRVCNFEDDEAKLRDIYSKVAAAIQGYLAS